MQPKIEMKDGGKPLMKVKTSFTMKSSSSTFDVMDLSKFRLKNLWQKVEDKVIQETLERIAATTVLLKK